MTFYFVIFQSLIDSTTSDISMAAEIVLVISNKAGVEGLKRAEKAGIPTEVIFVLYYQISLCSDEQIFL